MENSSCYHLIYYSSNGAAYFIFHFFKQLSRKAVIAATGFSFQRFNSFGHDVLIYSCEVLVEIRMENVSNLCETYQLDQ